MYKLEPYRHRLRLPDGRIVVLLWLATGCVLNAAVGAGKGKLRGEHVLLGGVRWWLKPGDILLDDAFYNFPGCHNAQGCEAVGEGSCP